jgi:WD40 repeat protein
MTLTPPPATTDHAFSDPALTPTYVGRLAFSPDGTKLASAAFETATIFDVGSGRRVARVGGWATLATNVVFTPDSQLLVVSGFQSVTLIFDPETGDQVGEPIGSNAAPASFATNGPDGTLATSGFSGAIQMVDLSSRAGGAAHGRPRSCGLQHRRPPQRARADRRVLRLERRSAAVRHRQRSEDRRPVPIARSVQRCVCQPRRRDARHRRWFTDDAWNIDSDQWQTTACAVAGLNLTRAEWEQYLPRGERYRATCPEHPESPT